MTTESVTFDLPPVMTLEDCQEFHTFLQKSQATPVILNCQAVTRVTGLAAQMIQFASQVWAANDVTFTLANPSDGCIETLNTLGLSDLLAHEGASA